MLGRVQIPFAASLPESIGVLAGSNVQDAHKASPRFLLSQAKDLRDIVLIRTVTTILQQTKRALTVREMYENPMAI